MASDQAGLPDDYSEWEPPDPLPNSEVKPLSADGSVGLPHVRVGHRQALKYKRPPSRTCRGFFIFGIRRAPVPTRPMCTRRHKTAYAPKVSDGGAPKGWRACSLHTLGHPAPIQSLKQAGLGPRRAILHAQAWPQMPDHGALCTSVLFLPSNLFIPACCISMLNNRTRFQWGHDSSSRPAWVPWHALFRRLRVPEAKRHLAAFLLGLGNR